MIFPGYIRIVFNRGLHRYPNKKILPMRYPIHDIPESRTPPEKEHQIKPNHKGEQQKKKVEKTNMLLN